MYIKIYGPRVCCKISEKEEKRPGLPGRDSARDSRAGAGQGLSPRDQSARGLRDGHRNHPGVRIVSVCVLMHLSVYCNWWNVV